MPPATSSAPTAHARVRAALGADEHDDRLRGRGREPVERGPRRLGAVVTAERLHPEHREPERGRGERPDDRVAEPRTARAGEEQQPEDDRAERGGLHGIGCPAGRGLRIEGRGHEQPRRAVERRIRGRPPMPGR